MIAVIDYGRGNIFSISRALEQVGAEYVITNDLDEIDAADKVILPGVGAFGDAMDGLKAVDLVAPLRRLAGTNKPLLGICVGCQLLLESGEEFGSHEGLGLIAGTVKRLPELAPDEPSWARIPNVGWRHINVNTDNIILKSLGSSDYVYSVHSYAPHPADSDSVAATMTLNGQKISVAVVAGNVMGVQFHPEKSGAAGLRLLKSFSEFEIS
jgi:imidazole glycerol-phosphate synthase subunit HisH